MRNLNSQKFQMTSQRIERMADGIALHKNEPMFPATLDEAVRRNMREELEAARTAYEQKQREADLAYDKFTSIISSINQQLSKDDDALRGYYGKDNPIMADFGTMVLSKIRITKKVKTPAGTKA